MSKKTPDEKKESSIIPMRKEVLKRRKAHGERIESRPHDPDNEFDLKKEQKKSGFEILKSAKKPGSSPSIATGLSNMGGSLKSDDDNSQER